jgi:hypothetical protein
VLEASLGDPLRQSLNQVYMAVTRNGPNPSHDVFIANDVLELVSERVSIIRNGQIEINANPLWCALFMGVDANIARQDEVTDEHMADLIRGVGNPQRLDNPRFADFTH